MNLNEDAKLVQVFRAADNMQAQIIKSLLEANGIPCVLTGEAVSRIYPITVDGLGEVPILVREEDAQAARAVLETSTRDVLS
mgnify:CR=1 FL=1